MDFVPDQGARTAASLAT